MDDKILQVGLLMGNVFTKHPMEVLKGLSVSAAEHNVGLTVIPGAQGSIYDYWDENGENSDDLNFSTYNYQYNSLYDYTQIAGLDALIVTFGTLQMYLSVEEKAHFFDKFKGIPLVILQEYNENEPYCYLIADNYKGLFNIVTHLIEVHNRKRIVYLGGPKMNTDASERLRGYYDAMLSHGLTVEQDMLAYGDYSSNVDYLVERLLDKYPDADAIACGNDEMAICAYRVCKARGLVIGRDISVTGFDDVEFASTLNPPLSTCRQDGFAMGRMALELALKGIKEEQKELHRLDIPLILRGSCGCEYNAEESSEGVTQLIDNLKTSRDPDYIRKTVEAIAADSMDYRYNIAVRTSLEDFFEGLINIINRLMDEELKDDGHMQLKKNLNALLRTRLDFSSRSDVNWNSFSKYFHRILDNYLSLTDDYTRILVISKIMQRTHEHIETMFIHTGMEQRDRLIQATWDAALVIQRLKERVHDNEAFLRTALGQVIAQGAKSSYLLLNHKPIIYKKGMDAVCPVMMRLVAKTDGDEITVYDRKEEETVSKKAGFTRFYPNDAGRLYMTFFLFSEEEQYGLLIAEIDPEQLSRMHGVSMQISNGLSVMSLTDKEDAAKNELKKAMRQLSDRNKILASVSSNDPMTGVHNRRGFMESALEIIATNEGKDARLFFCDLDHLKQINDEFGHADGDYAIKTLANVNQEVFGKKGCIARVGGDEFVAMVPCKASDESKYIDRVKSALEKINKTSGKPYYIECSMGSAGFICNENVDLEEIIKKADDIMYKDKIKRRASIRKEDQDV